jgi:hypothetical protein
MAIIIRGMPCRICGHAMEERDELVGFPPFVTNASDPLIFFSDGAFHEECFNAHPLAEAVVERLEEGRRAAKPWPPTCRVCGQTVTDHNDLFGTGHLSANPDDPLCEFNHVFAHESCVREWTRREALERLLKAAIASGEWTGGHPEDLLRRMAGR